MLDLHKQDLNNKRVIVRVDLNVPVDQMDNVTDITRIEACQATIELVLQLGGSCVLLSHLGRPRGKDKRFSLKKIVTTKYQHYIQRYRSISNIRNLSNKL